MSFRCLYLTLQLCIGMTACNQSSAKTGATARSPSQSQADSQVSRPPSAETTGTPARDNRLADAQDEVEENSSGERRDVTKAESCRKQKGTYVTGKGCYVCNGEGQFYDAQQNSCMIRPNAGEQAIKVVGGVFQVIGAIGSAANQIGNLNREENDDDFENDNDFESDDDFE